MNTAAGWPTTHTQKDFPDSPVVKTSPSNAGSAGSTPGQGAKSLHVSWPENQNIKQKQYSNKCNKDKNKKPLKRKKKTKNCTFFSPIRRAEGRGIYFLTIAATGSSSK